MAFIIIYYYEGNAIKYTFYNIDRIDGKELMAIDTRNQNDTITFGVQLFLS